MTAPLYRRRFLPQGPIEIDLSNSIARGLRFFVVSIGGGNYRELVQRQQATRNAASAAPTVGYRTRLGVSRAAALTAAATSYLEVANNTAYNITGDLTLLWSGSIASASAFRQFCGKQVTSGATNSPFDYRTDNANPPKAQLVRASAAGTSTGSSAQGLALNTPIHVGVTSALALATMDFFINGGAAETRASTLLTPTGNVSPLRIGRRADGSVQMDGLTEFVAGWARILDEVEFRSLYNNPYQLLQRAPTQSYFGVTSGAAFNAGWAQSANTVIQPGALQA